MQQEYKSTPHFQEKNHDLVSFIETSLENAATSEAYRQTAIRSGDPELARLFDRIKDESYLNARKMKQILRENH
ncbi:MAG: hypothetical protein SAJ12_08255 [Jaaginema sp. PMC 1079.18]|nr:hypothetical protein [Jaaginema sp. PMC 1080.18]MEC4850990.1 hypothetical protein [Jaaginema sp. PMC 1079.18]MEC4865113.1 hypothetical protein [Jaaginema sp. PMC 1078.18]